MRLRYPAGIIFFLIFFSAFGKGASENGMMVLKSINFRLYYTAGGEKLATLLIHEAENNLESMENFLGTRLVEQIDIFLTEYPIRSPAIMQARNGNVILDNSSVYLVYSGKTPEVTESLRERIAEILIVDMLYGNTVKERLKNNREINVPDWFVPGLSRYVAGIKPAQTGWMADYYEGKQRLNLNLSPLHELRDFGNGVFRYVSDTFGIGKLRQILFYTKLSGKTEYAFQFVLGKSVNTVISDWYRIEKKKYLKITETRLPNDPEPIGTYLEQAGILSAGFNQDGTALDFLLETPAGAELWTYFLQEKKRVRLFSLAQAEMHGNWCVARTEEGFVLTRSNGQNTKLYLLKKGRKKMVVQNTMILDFAYVTHLIPDENGRLFFIGQKAFTTGIYSFSISELPEVRLFSGDSTEVRDLTTKDGKAGYRLIYKENRYFILNTATDTMFNSHDELSFLKLYRDSFISFLQFTGSLNKGMILDLHGREQVRQVTNYSRSIIFYDYNPDHQKVMEILRYGKKNYLVVSDASTDATATDTSVSPSGFDLREPVKDTVAPKKFTYRFLTGFESSQQAKEKERVKEVTISNRPPVKIKKFESSAYEFKASHILLGFTNTRFHSPMFASFYPMDQGLNNGPNAILGCGLNDILKKYRLYGEIRQPLIGKGTDLFIRLSGRTDHYTWQADAINSVYQRESYNQSHKFQIRQGRISLNKRLSPWISGTLTTGFRADTRINLSESIENLKRKNDELQQAFGVVDAQFHFSRSVRVNYQTVWRANVNSAVYKPMSLAGTNTNLGMTLTFDQTFFRLLKLSSNVYYYSSVGKNKTAWVMGGVSNWLRPSYGKGVVYSPKEVIMFSAVHDVEGLPFNYKSGTSLAMGKLILSVPLNPVLSQQNFNQNIFKCMTLRVYGNYGTAWYGRSPFAVTNPENREEIETGSMTIVNFVRKNPMVWSYGSGMNSVVFGYSLGVDYALGFNERGRIGKYFHLTIGKEF